MPSFDYLLNPTQANNLSRESSKSYPGGIFPAIITSTYDPEGLGRVKVQCSLFSESLNLPNGSDGYAWLLENHTVNFAPGGSHTPIKEGTEVAIIPVMGDMRQWVVLGCFPNRQDRPHPEMDRFKNTYGEASEAGVLDVRNDNDQSRIMAYPHGVEQSVTGEGDEIRQTAGGARTQLSHDGTVTVENPLASQEMSPDGTVTQTNAAGNEIEMNPQGEMFMRSGISGAIEMAKAQVTALGPRSEMSQSAFDLRQALSGVLGDTLGILNNFKGLLGDLGQLPLDDLLDEAATLLEKLQQGINTTLPQALESIQKLGGFDTADFAKILNSNLTEFKESGLAELNQRLSELLAKTDLKIEEIWERLGELTPEQYKKNLDYQTFQQLYAGLRDKIPELTEATLEMLVGKEALKRFANLQGNDLNNNLAAKEAAMAAIDNPPEEKQGLTREQRTQELIDLFPVAFREYLTPELLDEALANNDPLTYAIAAVQKKRLGLSGDIIQDIMPTINLVERVKMLSQSLSDRNAVGTISNATQIDRSRGRINVSQSTTIAKKTIAEASQTDIGDKLNIGQILEIIGASTEIDTSNLNLNTVLSKIVPDFKRLTQGKALGSLNLSELLGTNIENIDLNDFSLNAVLGKITAGDLGGINLDRVNLSSLLGGNFDLSNINLDSFLPNGINLGDLDLGATNLSGLIGGDWDFSNLDLSSLPFGDLGGLFPFEPGEIEQFLQDILGQLEEVLAPILENLFDTLGPLFEGLADDIVGSLIVLNPEGGEIKAGENGTSVRVNQESAEIRSDPHDDGAKLEVSRNNAALVSRDKASRVFADAGNAGVATPWGGLSFGGGGGFLAAAGKMAMQALAPGGAQAAGLILQSQLGGNSNTVASLAATFLGKRDENNVPSIDRVLGEVTVDLLGNISLLNRSSNHGISINQEDVFIDDISITELIARLSDLENSYGILSAQISTLSAQVSTLESSSTETSTP